MSRKMFTTGMQVEIPFNGEKRVATIVDVLNTMLFVDLEEGGSAFVYHAEVREISENAN
mgnify:CR=1 FL=1|jgi:hypothetical protein|tara:strand:- start:320 stop:496 length:177 start_codon:yes stop_codon:yes gene_type:complete